MSLDRQGTVPGHFQKQNRQRRRIPAPSNPAGHMGPRKAESTGGWTCQWWCSVWTRGGWAALYGWICGRRSDRAPPTACRGSWLWRPRLVLSWKKTCRRRRISTRLKMHIWLKITSFQLFSLLVHCKTKDKDVIEKNKTMGATEQTRS